MTDPARHRRRSFIYRRLIAAGASFIAVDDAAVADALPDEEAAVGRLGLADLSPMPRTGFKGPDALAWLAGQGLTMPTGNNSAARQLDGMLAVRLSDGEALLLCALSGGAGRIAHLEAAAGPGCHPAPRRDSHAWFMLTGKHAVDCLRKLCGVDLRLHKFADHAVAQTSVARLSAIVIRDDRAGAPAFHLLADSAAAGFFWDALIDAMAEFDGRPVGLGALRRLD